MQACPRGTFVALLFCLSPPPTPPLYLTFWFISCGASQTRQFSGQFNSLLALCEILERGKFMAPLEAAELVVQARVKVENLVRVSQLDPSLSEENRIMRKLLEGIGSYAMGKGPASVALYIHNKVSLIADPEQEVLMAEVTADLERVRESMGIAAEDSDEFPAWDWGPAFGWARTEEAAHGGGSGSHGAYPAWGHNFEDSEGYGGPQGGSEPSTQYTAGRNGSPGRARGSGGAGRGHREGGHSSHGAGAPRKPICGMCSRKGAPADHSFRVCPGTTCYKCGKSGHVAQWCSRARSSKHE